MKFEDAERIALAMIAALGRAWALDLNGDHGWQCRVKNGPCTVMFNENSQTYSAFIRQGANHTGNAPDPVRALELAAGRMESVYRRMTVERDAIMAIAHHALGREVLP